MQWSIFARLNAAPVFCLIKRNHFLSTRCVYFGKAQSKNFILNQFSIGLYFFKYAVKYLSVGEIGFFGKKVKTGLEKTKTGDIFPNHARKGFAGVVQW